MRAETQLHMRTLERSSRLDVEACNAMFPLDGTISTSFTMSRAFTSSHSLTASSTPRINVVLTWQHKPANYEKLHAHPGTWAVNTASSIIKRLHKPCSWSIPVGAGATEMGKNTLCLMHYATEKCFFIRSAVFLLDLFAKERRASLLTGFDRRHKPSV
jgi:hypothetical protein